MEFTYFRNSYWADITRDERYFCSHLYHSIIGREQDFIIWLNKFARLESDPHYSISLIENIKWEVGYEVCFYRDLIYRYKQENNTFQSKDKNVINLKYFSPKRTFDLCLFSEKEIIIIEAKAEEGFTLKQFGEFKSDKNRVKELLSVYSKNKSVDDIKVKLLLLYSSLYKPRNEKIVKYPFITWDQLKSFDENNSKYFERADILYGEKRKKH